MAIWFKTPTPEEAQKLHSQTMVAMLGIEVTDIAEDFMVAVMPVDKRTTQIHGILHGGASVALAETLGSYAATCCVDQDNYMCVGLDINANPIRPVSSGHVTAVARPIHIGRRTQVWGIQISDSKHRLVCESRLTIAVVEKQPTP